MVSLTFAALLGAVYAVLELHWQVEVPFSIRTGSAVMALWLSFAFAHYLGGRRTTFQCLRQLGYDLCSVCGYWLRGLGDDVKKCPECGAHREPMPAKATERGP
jgi:hypothetical protein